MTNASDASRLCELEAAAARAWPATIERAAPGGWLLRATPGLDRARSNNALAPCRALDHDEIGPAIDHVVSFALERGIRPGIQVSPLQFHARLQAELDRREWETQWPTLVLAGRPDLTGAGERLTVSDKATRGWLDAWARCEPGRDVEAHARTVFELLRGRACFGQLGDRAVGIAVADDRVVGTFCVAVDPASRREGLGTALVLELLRRSGGSPRLAYLQVDERNVAARAMYERLGFAALYRYCHRTAPR